MGDLRPNNGGGMPPEDGGGAYPGDLPELSARVGHYRHPGRRRPNSTRRRTRCAASCGAIRAGGRLRSAFGLAPAGPDAPRSACPWSIMAVAVITTLLSLFVVTWDRRRSATAPVGPGTASATDVPAGQRHPRRCRRRPGSARGRASRRAAAVRGLRLPRAHRGDRGRGASPDHGHPGRSHRALRGRHRAERSLPGRPGRSPDVALRRRRADPARRPRPAVRVAIHEPIITDDHRRPGRCHRQCRGTDDRRLRRRPEREHGQARRWVTGYRSRSADVEGEAGAEGHQRPSAHRGPGALTRELVEDQQHRRRRAVAVLGQSLAGTAARSAASSPSCCPTTSRMRGPPGCTAQLCDVADAQPCRSSSPAINGPT